MHCLDTLLPMAGFCCLSICSMQVQTSMLEVIKAAKRGKEGRKNKKSERRKGGTEGRIKRLRGEEGSHNIIAFAQFALS